MATRLFEYSSSVIRGLAPVITPGGNSCCLILASWGFKYVLAISFSIANGSFRQSLHSFLPGSVVTTGAADDVDVVTVGPVEVGTAGAVVEVGAAGAVEVGAGVEAVTTGLAGAVTNGGTGCETGAAPVETNARGSPVTSSFAFARVAGSTWRLRWSVRLARVLSWESARSSADIPETGNTDSTRSASVELRAALGSPVISHNLGLKSTSGSVGLGCRRAKASMCFASLAFSCGVIPVCAAIWFMFSSWIVFASWYACRLASLTFVPSNVVTDVLHVVQLVNDLDNLFGHW